MTGQSLIDPVWCDLCREAHPMPAGECYRITGHERQAAIDRAQMTWLLEQATGKCLHVGCGEKYLEGMVNIDPNPTRPRVDHRYDVHDMPFEAGTFDSCISCHVIPSLRDPLRALAEMARVLKPGGVMAHVIPDNTYAPMRHSLHHQWQFQHNNWFSPEQFRTEVLGQVNEVLVTDLCEHFDGFRFAFRVRCVKVG